MSLLRPLRRPRLAVAVWVAMFLLVAIGSLMPAERIPTPPLAGLDKIEHLLGYAGLSAYAVLLFARRSTQWFAAACVVLFGVLIEGAQSALTVSREADPVDLIANTTGALLGQLLGYSRFAHLLERPCRKDVNEHRLEHRA